jgi:predicted enzyme related to lactoylglutathione lyase
MEMLTNAISWFEIPVADFSRAKKFYSTIYDYEMPVMTMGPNTLGFLLHEQGKGIGGAIVQGPGYEPTQKGAVVYLNGGR